MPNRRKLVRTDRKDHQEWTEHLGRQVLRDRQASQDRQAK